MVTVRVRIEEISYYHFLNVLSSQISLNLKIIKESFVHCERSKFQAPYLYTYLYYIYLYLYSHTASLPFDYQQPDFSLCIPMCVKGLALQDNDDRLLDTVGSSRGDGE